MKKALMPLMVLILTLVLALVSCTSDEEPGGNVNNPSNSQGSNKEGMIFDSSTRLVIVTENNSVPLNLINTVIESVNTVHPPISIKDTEARSNHEIVIGPTSRDISRDAYRKLESMAIGSDYAQFLIYSDGSSIAIAYEDNEYARDMAIDYFITNYLTDSELYVDQGVDFATDIVTLQEEYDIDIVKGYWSDIEKEIGRELTEALKTHYGIYSDKLISWFANLYEPEVCVCDGECRNTQYCGGGGYYYSNSARNTPGYLPDIESTNQALNFIKASGMTGDESISYAEILPDWMKAQIVRFVKIRQDPNGYFYHPQWTKDAVNAQVSRRSRDLGWATGILWEFGAKPTYDTPNNMEGDGMLWDGTPVAIGDSLTGRLSVSVVTAVSSIVESTAASYPSFLESADTFRNYLNSLDIDNRSYHVGNELVALTSEINAREKTLIAEGKASVVDVMIKYLNDHQNKQTGLWSDTVNYYSVNGLFKITGCYTDTNNPIPNSDKALRAAIDAITSDEAPGAVVDIYNTWYTILNILDNIERFQGSDAAAMAEEAIMDLRKNALGAVKATTEKVSIFLKDDGSFSYNPLSSSNTSQGMPVAIPGTNEGDVNATLIATTGTTNRMMKALGLTPVPLYTQSDWLRYESILEELGQVIKDEELPPVPVTFTNDKLGEAPDSVEYGSKNEYKEGLTVITDPTEGSSRGHVLEINSVVGLYNSVTVKNDNQSFNKACYVFEGDICIPNSTNGYVVRLRMADLYAFAFKVSDGKIHIWDVSTSSNENLVETDLGIAVPLGEWFRIKVEYYKGDHDSVRMKLYINDELAAVNDNYYDQYGKKLTNADGKGVPGTSYNYFGFSTMTGHDTRILLDNLCCYATNTLYEPYTDTEKPLKVNVDRPDLGEKIYPFDDMSGADSYPEDFTVSGGGVSIKTESGTDKVLNIKNSSSAANISVAVNQRAYKVNTDIVEMTLRAVSADAGATVRLTLGEADSSSSIVIFDLTVINVNGAKYIAVADAHGGKTDVPLPGVKIPVGTEARLKIEHNEDAGITLIYINGKLAAASSGKSATAAKAEFSSLNISYIGSAAIDINIDDLKAEGVKKEFNASVLSQGEEKKYTFNNSESSVPGAAVVGKDGDMVAELSSVGGSITIPLNNRSLLASMSVLTAGISFADGSAGEWKLEYKDDGGNTVFALLMKVASGKLDIYELDAGGVKEKALASAACTSELRFDITWFRDYKLANIYVNESYLAATITAYSASSASAFATEIKITAITGTGSLYIDDVIAENRSETDDDSEEDDGVNAEEDAEVITFESSSIKNLPSKITYKLSSAGSAFKLERTIREGILTKVISLSSYPGGNDEINIDATKKVSGANVVTFEADMYIDYADNAKSKIIEFYFRTKGGAANVYKFEIWQSQIFADGKAEVPAFPGEETWFRFKMEYYDGGKIIVYVNGTPVAASDNFVAPTAVSAAYVERIRVYTRADFEGQIKLDNVSLVQGNKIYKEPVIEGAGNELGENKDILDFEDGLVNESALIGQGSGNGSVLKVESDGTNKLLVYTTGASSIVDNQLNITFTKVENTYNAVVFETDFDLICSKSADHNYFRLKSTANTGNKRACFVAVTEKNIIVYYNGGSKTVGQLKDSGLTKLRIEYGDSAQGVFLKVFVDGACVYAEDNYIDQDSNRIPMADIDHMEVSTWRTNVVSKFDNIKLWRTTVDTSVKPEVAEIPGTDKGTPSMDGNKYTFENGNLPSGFGYQGDNGVFRTQDTDDHGKVLAYDSKTYGKSNSYNLAVTPTAVANATRVLFETDFYLKDNTDSALSSSAALEFKFTDGSKRIVKVCMGKSGELRAYYGESSSAVVTTLAVGIWYNIKIEYYSTDSAYGLRVLIDGTEMYATESYELTSNAASDKSPANVKKFDILTYGKIIAYFDNIVCTQE